MDFKEWIELDNICEDTSLSSWLDTKFISEAKATRYSVEVSYRSKAKEAMEAFAKIALGYVSASMKKNDYHVKHVFDEKPMRILISSRNWDDGEWVGVVHFNPDHDGGCFVISKSYYNKIRKTVSLKGSKKCDGDSASEIVKD